MVKRIIDTSFWEDALVVDKYTPEDKYFMLYLLTNPKTTAIGIYSLVPKIAAFDLGYSVDTINFLLERFEHSYKKIKYNDENREVAVKNSLKYTISKGGKPVEDMIDRELKAVKDNELLAYTYQNMLEWWMVSGRDIDNAIKERFEAELSKRNVPYLINANANANANANTDSDNESYNESSKPDSKLSEKQLNDDFNELWKLYPNKKSKQKAFTSYKTAIKDGVTNDEIRKGIESYNKEIQFKRTETQYIAHGSTWFSQRRWEDDYEIGAKVLNATFAEEAPTDPNEVEVPEGNAELWEQYLKEQEANK